MAARRKGALVGGIAVGVLGCFSLVRHLHRPAQATGSAGSADSSRSASAARWMPWLFGEPTPTPEPLPDLYAGVKVPITVKVVDLQSEPVSGAEVTMLSDPGYVLLGLSPEQTLQFKQLMEQRHQPLPAALDLSTDQGPDSAGRDGEESDSPGEDDHIVVGSGRTDRDGIWVAQVKP